MTKKKPVKKVVKTKKVSNEDLLKQGRQMAKLSAQFMSVIENSFAKLEIHLNTLHSNQTRLSESHNIILNKLAKLEAEIKFPEKKKRFWSK